MKDAGSAVALMGNPNVGKSTVFNALTGGRQHTGNWSGKTVSLAEGRITGEDITLIDLPGTYSLHARSQEEALAREFLTCGGAQAVILVADAACLQRSLVLVLQVLEVQPHAVLCLNLMDEARKKHIRIDTAALSRELGIPVVPCAARSKKGLNELKNTLRAVLSGTLPPCSRPPIRYPADIRCGLYAEPHKGQTRDELDDILTAAAVLRAEEITMTCVTAPDDPHARDRAIDRAVLSRRFGIPLMLLLLALVFWLTLSGANTVSAMLSGFLLGLEAPLRRHRAQPAVRRGLPAHRRRVARARDRRFGHAAAYGDLFPALHPARGRRLSAAHRASAGSCVLPRRRLRQAEPKHVPARAACAKKQDRMRLPILLKAIFRFPCPA